MFIYIYAFLVLGLVNAFKDISIKHSLKNISSGVLAGLTSFCTILLSLPFLYHEGIPKEFGDHFIWAFLFGGIFYYSGKFFNFTALKLGDISLISPMKGLITLSVIFTSFLLLGEGVSMIGGIGIFLVVLGTYLLALEKGHTSFGAPIVSLWKNKGSRMYLFCIMFYGFTVTIDRIGIQASSVWFWTVCMNAFVFIFSLPDLIKWRKQLIPQIKKVSLAFSLIVVLHFIVYVSKMYVVSEILAPYASAFTTSSSLFAVVIGGWFFKEKGLLKRFFSALVILVGVGLIGFFGS